MSRLIAAPFTRRGIVVVILAFSPDSIASAQTNAVQSVNADQQSPQRCTAAVVITDKDPRGIDFPHPVGTAFMVNGEGFIATNAHVVRAAEQRRDNIRFVQLMYPSRFFSKRFQGAPLGSNFITSTAVVIDVDDSFDVALLRTRGEPLDLECNPALRLGEVYPMEEVYFTGYPLSNDVPFTVKARIATEWAVLSRTAIARAIGTKKDTTVYIGPRFWMDVPVYGGFSGSAVHYVKDNSIVGIVSGAGLSAIIGATGPLPFGSNALGYAVPLLRLTEMLAAAKAKYQKIQSQ